MCGISIYIFLPLERSSVAAIAASSADTSAGVGSSLLDDAQPPLVHSSAASTGFNSRYSSDGGIQALPITHSSMASLGTSFPKNRPPAQPAAVAQSRTFSHYAALAD